MKGGAALKNKIFILAALAALIAVLFCGCSEGEKIEEEQNPEEFSYDMLDLSLVANEIYGKLEISELTSIVKLGNIGYHTECYFKTMDKMLNR